MATIKHVYPSDGEFTQGLSKFVIEKSAESIKMHGKFTIALSGGSAATMMSKSLQGDDAKSQIDWSKWQVFFCDERYVPLDHSDSNYKAVHDGFLSKMPISASQIHPINLLDNVDNCAQDYGQRLRAQFTGTGLPAIDLVVLGMGPDGHICSLFPNHSLLEDSNSSRLVVHIEDSPKPPPQRVTITLPVVNNGRNIIFICTGKGKAENIRRSIDEAPTKEIPASLVKANEGGELHWFMDRDAASLLKQ